VEYVPAKVATPSRKRTLVKGAGIPLGTVLLLLAGKRIRRARRAVRNKKVWKQTWRTLNEVAAEVSPTKFERELASIAKEAYGGPPPMTQKYWGAFRREAQRLVAQRRKFQKQARASYVEKLRFFVQRTKTIPPPGPQGRKLVEEFFREASKRS